MRKFEMGWAFEFFYWKEEYAVCLATKWYLDPLDEENGLSYKIGTTTTLA